MSANHIDYKSAKSALAEQRSTGRKGVLLRQDQSTGSSTFINVEEDFPPLPVVQREQLAPAAKTQLERAPVVTHASALKSVQPAHTSAPTAEPASAPAMDVAANSSCADIEVGPSSSAERR